MMPKVLPVHLPFNSPNRLPSQEIRMINWAKNIWLFCLVFALALWLHHQHYGNNGGSVPKPYEDALMISIMFFCMGAFSALHMRDKPQLAIVRRVYFVISMVSIASALTILAFALLSESSRQVSLGSILQQNRVNGEDHLNRFFLFLRMKSQKLF
ncbi:hypothetical protein Patl1_22425 [Pistacia atlantica]|uniref:Uncharacterized protein n=1 Tax=Pistacia atlantica TaxID=434234 RepID=A0ACC1A0S8_9ROSI|nr:hypothetical protein Patl1_22425 [Pistacia atlantica]